MNRQIRIDDSKYGIFDDEFLLYVPIAPKSPNFTLQYCIFFVHAPTSNRLTDFSAEWLKRRVSQGRSFSGSERWVTSYGENIPLKLSKNWRKQAISSQNAKIYTSKYLRNKWSDERSLWESSSDNERHFVGGLPLPQSKIKHGWWPPYWKSIWRHITALGGPIWTKFGSLMQNNTPITAKWSRSKPELQFQYGGRLFFQTRSSNISAVNGDMSTTFGPSEGTDIRNRQ